MPDHSFDVVVLGAGPAGEVCAGRLAEGGLSVAIVEEHLVGGECSFYACMPSKTLLRPGQALAEARRVPGAAQAATGSLDVPAALARRDEVIHDLDDSGMVPWLEERGAVLFRGHGVLDGERRVRLGDQVLEARRAIVVATGSSAALPIEGLAEAAPWTNREATTAKQRPGRLVVLGGGPVACELAQAWTTLGTAVTLVQREHRLLEREELFAAEAVADALREDGVDVRLGSGTEHVRREPGGEVVVTLDDGAEVRADEVLAALGRRPRTVGLGLDAFGVEDGRPIEVGTHLHSEAHPWLYAIGDVNGRVLLTHQGKEQARCAADHILGRPDCAPLLDGIRSPSVTFTDPQVASVGLTLDGAKAEGIAAVAIDGDMSTTAGGSFTGKGVPARARIVVDTGRDIVVGATFTGVDVAEHLHAATIAVAGQVPLRVLRHSVPSFPTRSEVWLQLLELA